MTRVQLTQLGAKIRVKKLKDLINKYRYHRLVLDKPIIEESVEDSLKKELFDLEQQFPDLVTPDSPTQRVAGRPLKKFVKFQHPAPMLSFNDAFGPEDMREWRERLKRLDPRATDGGFYCELKIDGLAIELIYERGYLKVGSTRGNGLIGEDVTQNLRTVEAIPLRIEPPKKDRIAPDRLIIRGEIFIGKKEFNKVNQEQARKNAAAYANPRNLAAGSVRQLDPAVTALRHLDSYAYSLLTDMGQEKHEDEHKILHDLGFKTNPHNKFCRNLDEVQKFRDYWEKHRENLDYEVDGIVVIVNDNKMFGKLGVVGKAPRAAIAYKFSPRESATKVRDIVVGIGRTGVLTPVAVLEPVEIGGTTVSRATLHNEDEIRRLDVRIGDTVVVIRAGDVIPDIKKVLTELRTGHERVFRFPKTCPVCGGRVLRAAGEAAYRCLNKDCPAIKRETIYHFAAKGAADIPGVGPKIIDQLMDTGLIKDAADLYTLTKEDLLNLERFADKSAENTINAIQSSKRIALDRFIYALSIPNVGSETALALARRFGTMAKLAAATVEELSSIRDIGEVIAKGIYEWFQTTYNRKLLDKLRGAGLHILKQESTQKSAKLKGLTFVFTGTLDNLSRERAEEMVRENGGNVSSSVSGETSYVVAGAEPGSKYDKAKKLGIKIISEKEFVNMIK